MRMWTLRINKIICLNKGETLVESVVSLLVLSLLLLVVTATIQTALRMTSVSLQKVKETQDVLNAVARSEYSESELAEITFSASGLGISAKHNIVLNKDGGIIAFAPSKSSAASEE